MIWYCHLLFVLLYKQQVSLSLRIMGWFATYQPKYTSNFKWGTALLGHELIFKVDKSREMHIFTMRYSKIIQRVWREIMHSLISNLVQLKHEAFTYVVPVSTPFCSCKAKHNSPSLQLYLSQELKSWRSSIYSHTYHYTFHPD